MLWLFHSRTYWALGCKRKQIDSSRNKPRTQFQKKKNIKKTKNIQWKIAIKASQGTNIMWPYYWRDIVLSKKHTWVILIFLLWEMFTPVTPHCIQLVCCFQYVGLIRKGMLALILNTGVTVSVLNKTAHLHDRPNIFIEVTFPPPKTQRDNRTPLNRQ